MVPLPAWSAELFLRWLPIAGPSRMRYERDIVAARGGLDAAEQRDHELVLRLTKRLN